MQIAARAMIAKIRSLHLNRQGRNVVNVSRQIDKFVPLEQIAQSKAAQDTQPRTTNPYEETFQDENLPYARPWSPPLP